MRVEDVRWRLERFDPGASNRALASDDYGRELTQFARASVLVGIVDRADEPQLLLTVRNPSMKKHAGQVAFPGGRADPGESAVETALREAEEEVALPPQTVDVIAPLSPYRTGTGYEVTPVVGILPPRLKLTPNEAEVAEIFQLPLAHALDRANHLEAEAEWQGRMRRYFTIDWSPQHVWGATAGIIVNLARILEDAA